MDEQRRGQSVLRATALLIAVVLGVLPGTAAGGAREQTVVRTHLDRPPDVVRKHVKFTPDAEPSVARVHEMIEYEHGLWGGPSVSARVGCESGYRWNATNGQYRGLIQAGSIWGYLWQGTPREIKFKEREIERKKVWRVILYSDGSRDRKFDHYAKVEIVKVKIGMLPANPSPYHGWAAIRVGQRALSGHGNTTSWSCSAKGRKVVPQASLRQRPM